MLLNAVVMLIFVLGVVAGVIVGVSTGSIRIGVVIAAAGFGIGAAICILNVDWL